MLPEEQEGLRPLIILGLWAQGLSPWFLKGQADLWGAAGAWVRKAVGPALPCTRSPEGRSPALRRGPVCRVYAASAGSATGGGRREPQS